MVAIRSYDASKSKLPTDPLQAFVEFLAFMKGLLVRLEREIGRAELSRKSIRSALVDFEDNLTKLGIRGFLSAYIEWAKNNGLTSTEKRRFSVDPQFEALGKFVESQRRKIASILAMIDRPQRYEDLLIRKSIAKFVRDGQKLLVFYETILPDERLSGHAVINEFMGLQPGGLNDNWAAAVCFLSALEVLVNRKFHAMDLKASKNSEFQARFRTVTSNLRSEGAEISELDSLYSSAFWLLRNKIIHEGYCPTHEELREIVEWTLRVFPLL